MSDVKAETSETLSPVADDKKKPEMKQFKGGNIILNKYY